MPKRWSVQYLAVNAQEDQKAAGEIRRVAEEYLEIATGQDPICIDDLFKFCGERLTGSREELLAGALSILTKHRGSSVGMGLNRCGCVNMAACAEG